MILTGWVLVGQCWVIPALFPSGDTMAMCACSQSENFLRAFIELDPESPQRASVASNRGTEALAMAKVGANCLGTTMQIGQLDTLKD